MITIDEINNAAKEIGTGVGIDGINPDISKVIPFKFKLALVKFLSRVHRQEFMFT